MVLASVDPTQRASSTPCCAIYVKQHMFPKTVLALLWGSYLSGLAAGLRRRRHVAASSSPIVWACAQ
eukprot:6485955-Pyramimonas_sp.AAC.1